MAKKTINLGTGPNTLDGDKVRTAFSKVNDNFDELYSLIGAAEGLDELAVDAVANALSIGSHVAIGVVYDDPNNKISLQFNGELNNLSDVAISGPTTGQVLKYNGTAWTNGVDESGTGGSVSSVSVNFANGFSGSVTNPSTTPQITLSTTVTGLLKGNGTAISAAVSGTDYQTPITTTGILKGNGTAISAAVSGTDYQEPIVLTTTGSGGAATLVGNTLNIPQYSSVSNLDSLSDVTVSSPNTDQILKFNGSNWINGNLSPVSSFDVTGILKTYSVQERVASSTVSGAGTINHDCSAAHIFKVSAPASNWTANFANLSLASGYATTVTVVVAQSGATGYKPTAVQVEGSAQTISWQGGTEPTASAGPVVDVVLFSIINDGAGYTVLGQLIPFGA